MSELLPCPFCGGTAKVYYESDGVGYVACNNCYGTDEYACMGTALSCVVDEWNTRPIEDALRARVVELETILAGDCAPCKCFAELGEAGFRIANLMTELADERAGRLLLAKATDTINDLQARVARLEEALREIVAATRQYCMLSGLEASGYVILDNPWEQSKRANDIARAALEMSHE